MTNEYEKYVKDIYKKIDKYQLIDEGNEEFSKHFDIWNFFEYNNTLKKLDNVDPESVRLLPGKIFLYEKLINSSGRKLYYPKVGIYLNSLPCDQTVELEWVDCRRNWEYNKTYEVDVKGETKNGDFFYLPSQVQSLPIWHDYLLIYGVWDKLPDWKELRKHYERTWWFHKTIQSKRDITINKLING